MTTRLWSRSETAEYLGVSEATLAQWSWKGTGPRSFKVGRHRKYDPSTLMSWLEDQADRPADPRRATKALTRNDRPPRAAVAPISTPSPKEEGPMTTTHPLGGSRA